MNEGVSGANNSQTCHGDGLIKFWADCCSFVFIVEGGYCSLKVFIVLSVFIDWILIQWQVIN